MKPVFTEQETELLKTFGKVGDEEHDCRELSHWSHDNIIEEIAKTSGYTLSAMMTDHQLAFEAALKYIAYLSIQVDKLTNALMNAKNHFDQDGVEISESWKAGYYEEQDMFDAIKDLEKNTAIYEVEQPVVAYNCIPF